MEQIKENICLEFGEDNVPQILFYHKHYGNYKNRDISEISPDTFKTHKTLISNELRKEFSKLNESFKLQMNIDNILNRHYKTFSSGLSAPGRNFIFSTTILL